MTTNDIFDFLSYLARERRTQDGSGLGASARARKLSAIKSFFKYLTTRTKLLDENPAQDIEYPRMRRALPKYLTLEESRRLLAAVDGPNRVRDYAILLLFLNCGIRRAELVGLNRNDIYNDRIRVTGKGNKERFEEGVQAVTTGAGNPGKFMELWKNAGVKVIPVVASVAMAKMMERAGADAVVAEGMESGGHIGSTTTMALVPQVVDAVSIPVIAAGGIADGRGMAAAFMLGAEGIQMGTRFVASKESIVHENYKNQIIKAKDIDSVVTGMSTGHPVRSLRNQMTREYLKLEKENADFMELEKLTLGSLRKAVQDGDTVNGTLMAGQIAGLIRREQTCREIIEETVQQAQECIAAQGQHK